MTGDKLYDEGGIEEPYELDFTIKGLPPTTNSNGRKHWAQKLKDAKTWKSLVFYSIPISKRPISPLTKATLELTRFSSGRCDFDGLVSSFKHVIDGLVEAGIILDDSEEIIDQPRYRSKKCSPGEGYIQVKVSGL